MSDSLCGSACFDGREPFLFRHRFWCFQAGLLQPLFVALDTFSLFAEQAVPWLQSAQPRREFFLREFRWLSRRGRESNMVQGSVLLGLRGFHRLCPAYVDPCSLRHDL